MKKKQNITPYFLIFGTILLLMSIPKRSTELLRGITVAMLAPAWEEITDLKYLMTGTPWLTIDHTEPNTSDISSNHETIQQLQLENQKLRHEVNTLEELFEHELFLINQITRSNGATASLITEPLGQHQKDLSELFTKQLDSIPAKVIFRSASSWSSSLWIDVGETENIQLGKDVIQKNSPVVVGDSIIGVIDYVGSKQSRVRLITDSGLTPSVRVARGTPQDLFLMDHLHAVMGVLATRNDLFKDNAEKNMLIAKLEQIKSSLNNHRETLLLAKGEIQGSSRPLWRSRGQKLKGIGFNYDFADDEGPSRDLRSGEPVVEANSFATAPLIQNDDLLVTTGFDGIFPPGLRVAHVSKIHLLREGDYYYELEATPTAGDLNELFLVYVLPPVGYDPDDQAPYRGGL